MLRFLTLLSLRCLAGLSIVGVLIAHQWGWSEYASPELYVVYYQLPGGQPAYFIVNDDGGSSGQPLNWPQGIHQMDCSPDGRVMAFLDDNHHLYVMNAKGALYDRVADRAYSAVSVANDGTTALFDADSGAVLLHTLSGDVAARMQPEYYLDRFDISAQGFILWNQKFEDIRVVAPASGETVAYVPQGTSGAWMAPPHLFTYYDLITDPDGRAVSGGQYVMDTRTQTVMRLAGWTMPQPVSPDGMEVAGALVTKNSSKLRQVVVYNLWGAAHHRELTHDPDRASIPLCYLTFVPPMTGKAR